MPGIPLIRGPRFYGWWIVGAGFVIEALMGALFFHAYGAYVVVLRREFGWSKTMFSAAFSMARAESGILGPVQGWLTDRFGPRTLIRIGLAIFSVGFMLFSQIGSPLAFFLTFFLMALGWFLQLRRTKPELRDDGKDGAADGGAGGTPADVPEGGFAVP